MSSHSYKQLDADDPLRPLQKFCEVVTYCKTLGLYAVAVNAEAITLAMPPSAQLLGDAERKLLHTGAITTLVDSACGVAVLHALQQHEPIATLDLRVDFLRPAPADEGLLCEAYCYRLTSNVAFVRANCYLPNSDKCIATAVGSFMRLKPRTLTQARESQDAC